MRERLQGNIRRFYAFRILFHARFYYPVFAIIFLDYGLTIEQFAVLNTIWAATIVLLEVPSGAMADALGRVALLRLASVLMVLEMLLILLAPVGHGPIVFWMLLLNRVLSGTAEAMASGADEALAYDSLVALHKESQWSRILEHVMRYQSLGFVLAMITGGLLYDRALINNALGWLGLDLELEMTTVIRLPILATLVFAGGACVATAGMCDPGCHAARNGESTASGFGAAWRLMLETGRRVLTHPVMLLVILAGVFHDSIMRLLLTLGSEYYRVIGIPAKYYGVLGALSAAMGLVLPSLGRVLVGRASAPFNFALVAGIAFCSFVGAALVVPIVGFAYMLLMMAGFSLLGYFVSFYLNREAESRDRATVLSFKGLAYNLGYGALGLIYAGYCKVLQEGASGHQSDYVFRRALWGFPAWFAGSIVVLALLAVCSRERGRRRA